MEMIKFPKIGQFKDVIRHVRTRHDYQGKDESDAPIYRHDSPYPTLTFEGTIKLHGTNAAIVFDADGNYHIQSRSRVINVVSDNAGFAAFVAGLPEEFMKNAPRNFAVYGEWCGGNIQSGVAINGLPKMFVIFAYRDLENDCWLRFPEDDVDEDFLKTANDANIYHIWQFPKYTLEIDFNHPELVQNEIIKLVEAVEAECPVGKHFGNSGIGEGIVWKCLDDLSSEFWFKTKGEKHSVSKVRTVAEVDVEKMNSVKEFVDATVTTNRLEQGLDVLKERNIPLDMKSTGDYLRWVVTDILEEEAAMLGASGLCAKDVGGEISRRAREFWFNQVR